MATGTIGRVRVRKSKDRSRISGGGFLINIFTTDIEALRAAAEIRSDYFTHPPASTLVQIERLATPGLLVEIEAIAVLPE